MSGGEYDSCIGISIEHEYGKYKGYPLGDIFGTGFRTEELYYDGISDGENY